MGKHGGGSRPLRLLPIVVVIGALAAVVGLGWWWWSLRDPDDPISANPVSSYGDVVTSDPCSAANPRSTLRFNTPNGYVTSTVAVCGYAENQSLLIEYLASDPALVRPASAAAAEPTVLRRLVPIGILAAGIVGAGALLLLVRGTGSAHRAGRISRVDNGAPAGSHGESVGGATPLDLTQASTEFPHAPAADPTVASSSDPDAGPSSDGSAAIRS